MTEWQDVFLTSDRQTDITTDMFVAPVMSVDVRRAKPPRSTEVGAEALSYKLDVVGGSYDVKGSGDDRFTVDGTWSSTPIDELLITMPSVPSNVLNSVQHAGQISSTTMHSSQISVSQTQIMEFVVLVDGVAVGTVAGFNVVTNGLGVGANFASINLDNVSPAFKGASAGSKVTVCRSKLTQIAGLTIPSSAVAGATTIVRGDAVVDQANRVVGIVDSQASVSFSDFSVDVSYDLPLAFFNGALNGTTRKIRFQQYNQDGENLKVERPLTMLGLNGTTFHDIYMVVGETARFDVSHTSSAGKDLKFYHDDDPSTEEAPGRSVVLDQHVVSFKPETAGVYFYRVMTGGSTTVTGFKIFVTHGDQVLARTLEGNVGSTYLTLAFPANAEAHEIARWRELQKGDAIRVGVPETDYHRGFYLTVVDTFDADVLLNERSQDWQLAGFLGHAAARTFPHPNTGGLPNQQVTHLKGWNNLEESAMQNGLFAARQGYMYADALPKGSLRIVHVDYKVDASGLTADDGGLRLDATFALPRWIDWGSGTIPSHDSRGEVSLYPHLTRESLCYPCYKARPRTHPALSLRLPAGIRLVSAVKLMGYQLATTTPASGVQHLISDDNWVAMRIRELPGTPMHNVLSNNESANGSFYVIPTGSVSRQEPDGIVEHTFTPQNMPSITVEFVNRHGKHVLLGGRVHVWLRLLRTVT